MALLSSALISSVLTRDNEALPVSGVRLVAALSEWGRGFRARGVPLPATVSLDDLIRLGHLKREDARSFDGASLTFHTDVDETKPQGVLIEARMTDGTWLAILGDGSVQQFTPKRSLGPQSVQPAGPANGGQPSSPDPTSTPPAAGTRR